MANYDNCTNYEELVKKICVSHSLYDVEEDNGLFYIMDEWWYKDSNGATCAAWKRTQHVFADEFSAWKYIVTQLEW